MKLIFFKQKNEKKKKLKAVWALHWHWYNTACVGHKLPQRFCTEKDNMYCVVMLCKIKRDQMSWNVKRVFYGQSACDVVYSIFAY